MCGGGLHDKQCLRCFTAEEYEKGLSNEVFLMKTIGKSYLTQYRLNSKATARDLTYKESLDHYARTWGWIRIC